MLSVFLSETSLSLNLELIDLARLGGQECQGSACFFNLQHTYTHKIIHTHIQTHSHAHTYSHTHTYKITHTFIEAHSHACAHTPCTGITDMYYHAGIFAWVLGF